ncbi:hypothetical protein PTMSG1_01770 [Pyrenophora teres f. maculata]|nr:hypothetical protein PTMSG1_01770 [Pyrenophora teres f. maculata]
MGLILFGMAVGTAIYLAVSSPKVEKQSPEVAMSKQELKELLESAVRGEVHRQVAARESERAEALEDIYQHKVRIAALEDGHNKAMREIGALQATINATKPSTTADETLPAPLSTPSPSSSSSTEAPSHRLDNSDAGSIYGDEDYESSPRASSSPRHMSGVSSPQLDEEMEDELAELGGWGLDEEASDDVTDGDITDEDAEGETDDGNDDKSISVPPTASEPLAQPFMLGQRPVRPLSEFSTLGENDNQIR